MRTEYTCFMDVSKRNVENVVLSMKIKDVHENEEKGQKEIIN